MKKTGLKTASVLAFERKLSTSDGIMFAGQWKNKQSIEGWQPITIQEKAVRGTISNRLKNPTTTDSLKLDAEIQNANLQWVDVAALPFYTDTLKISFTLRVLGDVVIPVVCNNQDYRSALVNKLNPYIEEHRFSVLASRYAENIANGRFLWRNRVGAAEVEVHVLPFGDEKQEMVFHSDQFDLRTFSQPTDLLSQVTALIQEGLSGQRFIFFKVDAFVRLGVGQEVFPSQELSLKNDRDNKKSRILYQIGGQAAIHSQKIGNALRTIDTWYMDAEELGPIAIEPYGAVTTRGAVYRRPEGKQDFYTLLDGWIIKDRIPPLEQQHYVVANLIRGGVFGETDKAEKTEKVE